MISRKCFDPAWLRAKSSEIKAGDPGLLEKAVHALALLGHLADSGLDFVFKGGTSLLLHVPVIRRLSIDIDIMCSTSAEELSRILAQAAAKPPFVRFEEDDRGARGLPTRRHFRFFYQGGTTGNFILLDVVEENRVPHKLIAKSIILPFLEMERDVRVQVPTIESLLADKLAAFAPRTIGILLEPAGGRPPEVMQIMKQLFDVGELFMLAEDMDEIRETYKKVFALENGYRGDGFKIEQTLDDSMNAALRLCRHKLRGITDHPDALLLDAGRKKLQSHLVNHQFNLDAAKVAAAKVGLLSRLILSKESNSLSYWRNQPTPEDLRSLKIDGEWERLNRLKQTIPEAFHYWHQASLI